MDKPDLFEGKKMLTLYDFQYFDDRVTSKGIEDHSEEKSKDP